MVYCGRTIEEPADLAEGVAWLRASDPRLVPALELGPLPLRRWPEGFEALLDAIIGQQVSVASASAIRRRMEAGGLWNEDACAEASDDAFRAAGMSRQKTRYARALAQARLDYASLGTAPDEHAIATLVALPGIGRWTAEIYAMFSLGRADVFACGDLALQEAARALLGLATRPSEKVMREISLGWSPWRAVAARALWAYYRGMKGREGVRA